MYLYVLYHVTYQDHMSCMYCIVQLGPGYSIYSQHVLDASCIPPPQSQAMYIGVTPFWHATLSQEIYIEDLAMLEALATGEGPIPFRLATPYKAEAWAKGASRTRGFPLPRCSYHHPQTWHRYTTGQLKLKKAYRIVLMHTDDHALLGISGSPRYNYNYRYGPAFRT